MERWRKPSLPRSAENAADEVRDFGDGVERGGVLLAFDEEQLERRRLGYVCLKCWEPHETPFPERCGVCGYAMRDNQAADFAKQFDPTRRAGPSTSIAEELDIMRIEREKDLWVPGQSIAVPRVVPKLIVPRDGS